jgi:hypothetical protein
VVLTLSLQLTACHWLRYLSARRSRGKGDPTATGAVRGNERDMTRPDISGLLAYWDRVAPLPPPSSVSTSGSPAQIAREVRLRTEAARQVEESRRERGAE